MLNALPTDKKEILLIAHNSDYDCIFMLESLQNVNILLKVIGVYILKQPTITQFIKRRLK